MILKSIDLKKLSIDKFKFIWSFDLECNVEIVERIESVDSRIISDRFNVWLIDFFFRIDWFYNKFDLVLFWLIGISFKSLNMFSEKFLK